MAGRLAAPRAETMPDTAAPTAAVHHRLLAVGGTNQKIVGTCSYVDVKYFVLRKMKKKTWGFCLWFRPTLMRDRKRKIPDRKSAVSDLAKSFSFREQKLSYVRSKNRLGFTCGVSCIPLFASSNADR